MATSKTGKLATVDGGDDDDVSRQTLGIGEDLFLGEILPRIPVKHLIRSKLVSKKWNSMISSPEFAKLHLNFSHANTLNRNFIIDPRLFFDLDRDKKEESYFLVPFTERSNVNDVVVLLDQVTNFRKEDWYSLQMVDSCNGLVCLILQYRGRQDDKRLCFFKLWNPTTGECRDIPSPEGVHVSDAHGFGYVRCIDDYFIVASFGDRFGNGWNTTFRGFYVWWLKTGEWERIVGRFDYIKASRKWESVRHNTDEECVAERLHGAGIMVGDSMFWVSVDFVGFDLVRKKFKVYPWLDWLNEYGKSYGDMICRLYRVKGCLVCLFVSWKRSHVCDFWMLKNPNDWSCFSSWEKILSGDFMEVGLLTFSETGKCLVQQFRQPNEFSLVEPCKEALEEYARVEGVYKDQMIAKEHLESFVSPFGITKEDTSGFDENGHD